MKIRNTGIENRKSTEQHLQDAMNIIRDLQSEKTQLFKTIRNLKKEEDTRAAIREEIIGILAHDPAPPAWVNRSASVTGDRGIPTTLWCDWHLGEVVKRETTNGLNEFNFKVARRRAATLVDHTVELAYEHMGRAKSSFPGAVVMIGGDMITGNIHPELAYTNDLTNQEAINETTDLLASCLDRMASKFGKLFVPAVTGNHPRDTSYARRMMHKMRNTTSHEWVIYCNLLRYFKKHTKHIQFYIPGGTDAIFSVVGHRYLLTHGDANGVKGGDGIIGALGPIVRGALKVHDSEAQIGVDIDTIVMGHWHQNVNVPGVIVGNSFIGYNEHGRTGLRAKFTTPSQALWFTHPKYGITLRAEVYLESKIQPHKGPWVTWKS
jgi:hypothetical protein